jgi:hypothetical protein
MKLTQINKKNPSESLDDDHFDSLLRKMKGAGNRHHVSVISPKHDKEKFLNTIVSDEEDGPVTIRDVINVCSEDIDMSDLNRTDLVNTLRDYWPGIITQDIANGIYDYLTQSGMNI